MAADIYPTKHVLEKLAARDVTWGEIVDAVENPDVIYGPDYRGRKTVQKGDLCVIVGKDGAVVTVLMRQTEQWTDDDARNRRDVKTWCAHCLEGAHIYCIASADTCGCKRQGHVSKDGRK